MIGIGVPFYENEAGCSQDTGVGSLDPLGRGSNEGRIHG